VPRAAGLISRCRRETSRQTLVAVEPATEQATGGGQRDHLVIDLDHKHADELEEGGARGTRRCVDAGATVGVSLCLVSIAVP
jgi:hypothetical protein